MENEAMRIGVYRQPWRDGSVHYMFRLGTPEALKAVEKIQPRPRRFLFWKLNPVEPPRTEKLVAIKRAPKAFLQELREHARSKTLALADEAGTRFLGHITYSVYGEGGKTAASVSYYPKSHLGARKAKGLGYYLEAACTRDLVRQGVRFISSGHPISLKLPRLVQLFRMFGEKARIGQEVEAREWLKALGRGIRTAGREDEEARRLAQAFFARARGKQA